MDTEGRISCKELIKALERDLAVLKMEDRATQRLCDKLDQHVERYNAVASRLADKLVSLRCLANARQPPNDSLIRHFADHMSAAWTYHARKASEASWKLRLPSRTTPGAFLCSVKERIKKRLAVTRRCLDLVEIGANNPEEDRGQARLLIDEAWAFVRKLEQYDSNFQRHLSMSSLMPRLSKLEDTVDLFVSNCEVLLPPPSAEAKSLRNVFKSVSDSITGKLLGEESIEVEEERRLVTPRESANRSVYRKPVFIFRKPWPTRSSQ